MKYKTTKKAVNYWYGKKICVGYADLQHLLRYEDANGYTCGVYGWNANIYEIDGNTAIITGYRPFGNIHPDYEIIRQYNKQAEEIQRTSDSNTAKEKTKELLQKFVDEVTAK